MPLTVAQLVALPELGLVVHTQGASLDREVRWVAVAEHVDPRPWIAAGDLLLTTGLTLDAAPAAARAYVDRLVAAGVAGLGFGFGAGLTHQQMPEALTAAAEEAGLPLFEVPEPVPFVALGKAVSRLLAAQEYAEASAAFDSQRRLLRAALDPADGAGAGRDADGVAAAILAVVARHVGGFALLLDAAGDVRVAQPAAAGRRAGEFAAEVERLRPRGLRGSASLATADEQVSILPVGVRGAADAFLVAGAPRALRPADQGVLSLAVSLLARPVPTDPHQAAWHALLVRHARVAGLPADLVGGLGLGLGDVAHAAAVVVRADRDDDGAQVAVRADHDGLVLAPTADGGAEGFARLELDGAVPAALARLAATSGVRGIGVSAPVDLREAANVRQAFAQAVDAAAGRGLRRHGTDGAAGLLDLVEAASLSTWSRSYLAPLVASEEGLELAQTVRAWLAQHGQVDAAAHRLGVHRHTVRHRLRRAESALGRSFDDPQVRADLWIALAAMAEDVADVPAADVVPNPPPPFVP